MRKSFGIKALQILNSTDKSTANGEKKSSFQML